jgi:sigma-B regulation protein RsbU (phosphoserine phosphatase)
LDVSPKKDGRSERILVVEDDPITRRIVTKLLKEAGYGVHDVADGQACLDHVGEVDPQLILLDISMPVLNGIETCRQLKADTCTSNIPVIFVTGNVDDETLEKAFRVGGCDYVRKPVNRVELLARVWSAFNQIYAMRKLAEEERLKGVLETAGGVCHELNQPLQYILGAIQILMMDIAPEDAVYKSLESVLDHVEQMGDITRRLAKITQYRSRKYAGGQNIIDISSSIGQSSAEK